MIDYDEDWLLSVLFQRQGSVAFKAASWSWPTSFLCILFLYVDEWLPGFREDYGLLDVNKSQIWAAMTGSVIFLVGFRTRLAFNRFWEGTGLLHQMRGEWFDTVSNCVTFSIGAKPTKQIAVTEFRHTIIRLMSLCHGAALEEIAGNSVRLETIDTFGLDDGTLNHLQECHLKYNFNKVEVMLHLLQSLITKALDDGVLKIPPPICSRVYQTISRGFVNLLNSKKIQDTKFPFPYTQMITILLMCLELVIPLVMSTLIRSKVICAFFSFVPMWGLFALNFVAQELENPFGTDDNDLPLEHFQTEMNNCLMMLLHPNTDLIAGVSDRCDMEFKSLTKAIKTHAEQDDHYLEDRPDGEQVKKVRHKTRRLSEYMMHDDDEHEPQEEAAADAEAFHIGRESGFGWAAPVDPPAQVTASQAASCSSAKNASPESPKGAVPAAMDSRDVDNRGGSAPTSAGDIDIGIGKNYVLDERAIPLQIDLSVSMEGDVAQRQTPRVAKPLQTMMGTLSPRDPGWSPESIAMPLSEIGAMQNDSWSPKNGSVQNIGALQDLQPVLAKNMDQLMESLQAWTKNVEAQVDNLNSNTTSLKGALKRFGDGLPYSAPPSGTPPSGTPPSVLADNHKTALFLGTRI